MANDRSPAWVNDLMEEQGRRGDDLTTQRLSASQRRLSTPRVTPFDSQLGMTHGAEDLAFDPDDALSDLFPHAVISSSSPLTRDSTDNIGVTSALQTTSLSPVPIRAGPAPPIGVSPRGATVHMPVGAAGSTTVTSASAPPSGASAPPSGAVGAASSLPPDGVARARAASNARRFGDPPARLRALVERQNRRRRTGAMTRTTTTTTSRRGRPRDSDDSLGTPRRSPPSWGAPSPTTSAPGSVAASRRHTPPTPGSAARVPTRSLRRNYDRVVEGQRRRIGRRGAHSVTETHTTTIVYKDGRPPEVHRNSSRHTTPNTSNQSGSGQLLPLEWFVE